MPGPTSLFFPKPYSKSTPEWMTRGAVFQTTKGEKWAILEVGPDISDTGPAIRAVNLETRGPGYFELPHPGIEYMGERVKLPSDMTTGHIAEREFDTFRGLYLAMVEVATVEPDVSVIVCDDETSCRIGWTLFALPSAAFKRWTCTFYIHLHDLKADTAIEPKGFEVLRSYIKTFAGRRQLGVTLFAMATRRDVPEQYLELMGVIQKFGDPPRAAPRTWAERLVEQDVVEVDWHNHDSLSGEL